MDQASKGAPQGDIMSYYNYLNNVNTNCAVTGGKNMEQVFCTAGNAMVIGMNIGSVYGGTSSRWYEVFFSVIYHSTKVEKELTTSKLCSDYVAFAVSWSYLNCLKAVPSQNSALVAAGELNRSRVEREEN
jgi:hypothetical protein